MARLTIIVAGGTPDQREEAVDRLYDAFRIMTRTDGQEPRVLSTEDDPDEIRFKQLTS